MPKPPAKCGTPSGYQLHHRRKEKACTACMEARRDYDRRRKLIQKAQALRDTGVTLPAIDFAEVYLASPPQIQELIEQRLGVEITDDLVAIYDQYHELKEKKGA